MRRFFTFLKWIFIILIIFVLHAYLTGNTHVFKTLSYTILKGRLSPGIDTYKTFPTRKVRNGTPQPWLEDPQYGKVSIDKKYTDILEKHQSAAFLVIHDGKLLYEDYFAGYNSHSLTNSWSMAKSIISLLVGVAIKEGKIKSVNQEVADFLPEYAGTGLKIRHLLTMSSGINFKEQYINPYGYTAKALYGRDLKTLNSKYRVNHVPGQYFIYLSGNTQVLGFLLIKATGRNLSDYASEKIWRKIGAENPAYWSLDETGGTEKAFCCFHSNARDFARIGQLMLQHGIWGNDTIISPSYFNASTSLSKIKLLEGGRNDRYGYQWWIAHYKGLDITYARGIAGQYIITIPAKNLIIVRLGKKRDDTKIKGHSKDFYEYVDAALGLLD
jgi:CubicO group peptidase (beta-lactamase class C family)